MSRNSKARRRARKARPKHPVIDTPTDAWGDGPPLTPEERARVLSRYRDLRGRNVRFGFVLLLDGWVNARTPEELDEAVRTKLAADLAGKPSN